MRTALRRLWERLHASYWFVPVLMISAATAMAVALLNADNVWWTTTWTDSAYFYGGSAQGAQQLLSALAGSMMTAAAMTFSVLVVVLSLASQQFGPRLLRNYLADAGNQFVIGGLIATYVYLVLVLSRVHEVPQSNFVPRIATTAGLLLAVGSFILLLYFVHHTANSVRVGRVINRVGNDLRKETREMYPRKLGREPAPQVVPPRLPTPQEFRDQSRVVVAGADGYIETVELRQVMKLAVRHDLVIRLLKRPGQHLVRGGELMLAWPLERVNEHLARKLTATFSLLRYRTPTQDIEFSIEQLVEVAVRALSPGINDPFTAIACIDELAEALATLASMPMPSMFRYDERGRLRVICELYTFEGITRSMFAQIRQATGHHVAVAIRLLEALAKVAPGATRAADRRNLLEHAALIRQQMLSNGPQPQDAQDVEQRYQQAVEILRLSPPGGQGPATG
jgi:uncharacterized membrane protein